VKGPRPQVINQQVLRDRGLPANLDAERFVLGAILMDDAVYIQVAGLLEADDFSLEKHRRIFLRMGELYERGEPLDRVTIANELLKHNQLEADGVTYIVSLDEGLPTLANLGGYIRIVREKSMLRTLIWSANAVVNEALLETDPAISLIEAHVERMKNLSSRATSAQAIESIPSVAECGNIEVEYLHEPILYGGAVIALTGDAGAGKSTFATFLAGEAAAKGTPTLILDRENPRSTVADRLDRLGIVDGPLLRVAGGWLPGGVLAPSDPSVLRWVESSNPKPLVVVDSLSAFFSGDENEAGEMRKFMQSLRNLADGGCCVLLLHHDGKAETAKDYRGSSDFKAAIDQGFHMSNFGTDGRLGLLKLRCYKSRLGTAGELLYHYQDGSFLRGRGDAPLPAAEQFCELLRLHPGVTVRDFQRFSVSQGLGRNHAAAWLGEAVLAGTVRREPRPGRGGGHRHFLVE
jgi:hypothetical protein